MSPPTLPPAPGTPDAEAVARLVLRAQAALVAGAGLEEGATRLAVEVARQFAATRVFVAVRTSSGDLRLAGTSVPTTAPDLREPGVMAAMHEALDQSQPVAWPPLPARVEPVRQAHRQLAGPGAGLTVPLVDRGALTGAITLQRESPFSPADLELAGDIALLAGPVLELRRRAELPWFARVAEPVRVALATPSRRLRAWGIGAVVAALVLALPVPWRVSAPARLEGEVQRAVVAATDGFLHQANVRPGDHVQAGQVLAQLASQDLELERRRRESEVQQHEAVYRAAQARYDRAQMVTAQAKAAEAQAMLALATAQLERSRVLAPFDGVVIKGDLRSMLGAPVQRGEVLMVLAPSERFRLILEVDETDVGAVLPGQHGQLALAAQPGDPLPFTVQRLVPVATTAEGRNYFEVEGRLDTPAAALRPGLTGIAKVDAGSRSIFGLLTHRAFDWLRLAWWSVVP